MAQRRQRTPGALTLPGAARGVNGRRYVANMDIDELIARESIRHTLAAYNHFGDRGQLAQLAETFTPDGTFEITRNTNGGAVGRVQGRENIVAMLGGLVESGAPQANTAPGAPAYIRHCATNVLITVHDGYAEAASYFAVITSRGLDHWGRYRDTLVPYEGRWLISERQVRLDPTDSERPDA
jgi:hypothetical protein